VSRPAGAGGSPARRGNKPRSNSRSKAIARESSADPEVAVWLRELDHPLKREIESVRKAILEVSPTIGEGIKWNAASFKTDDFFATLFTRSRDSLQLILHQGTKVKDGSTKPKIADPSRLLKWISSNRCIVTLGRGKAVEAHRAAMQAIVREWIAQL